jgi:hypothetical protein
MRWAVLLCVQTTLFFDMITKTWEFAEDREKVMKEDSKNGQDKSTCLEQRRNK